MNPWAILFIVVGIVLMVVGYKGTYTNLLRVVTGK